MTEEIESNNELLELLNTEVSTASKYTQTISEAPASVTIISSEDIRKYSVIFNLTQSERVLIPSNDNVSKIA